VAALILVLIGVAAAAGFCLTVLRRAEPNVSVERIEAAGLSQEG